MTQLSGLARQGIDQIDVPASLAESGPISVDEASIRAVRGMSLTEIGDLLFALAVGIHQVHALRHIVEDPVFLGVPDGMV